MKSLLSTPLSSSWLWEAAYYLLGIYLFFFPPWTYPQSMAVALGGGVLLLLFKPIEYQAWRTLGQSWILFLGYLLISTFWSLSPGMTLQSAGLFFMGTILYLMARSNDHAGQSRMEVFVLLLGAGAALKGLHQWFFGFGVAGLLSQMTGQEHDIVEAAVHNQRSFGFSATPGALAALLLLLIPQAFVLAKINLKTKKILYGFLFILLLAGLAVTKSVGAFLCLTLAVLAVLLARSSLRAAGAMLGMGLLAIGALIFSRGLHSWLLAALGMRLTLWRSVWGLFLQHPWFGTGLGTFGDAYRQAGLNLDRGALFPHNIVLQLLVETGSTGALLFTAAVISFARRFKAPFRWEGWGVMTGGAAFLLFSLLDLPFQMTELVWFFTALMGRLELRKEEKIFTAEKRRRGEKHNSIGFLNKGSLEAGLLIVFLVAGFWPPFRPWNFCILASALWTLSALSGQKFDRVPLWIAGSALYLGVRAFFSPSAMGTVWFLETAGILLAFYLVLPCLGKPDRFLKLFYGLGLVWALKAWWASFRYSQPGLSNWLHFQYSDVKDWLIFPNPKQLSIFLAVSALALATRPWRWAKVLAGTVSLLTILRLRASTGMAALLAGLCYRIFYSLKSRFRVWIVAGVVLFLAAGGLFLRTMESSSTKWERFGIWGSAIKVWEMDPVFGVGPGAFAGLYHRVPFERTTGVNHFLMDPRYAHNEYLDLLCAFGFLGFLFMAVLLAVVWRRIKDPLHRSGLTGLGAASFFDFCLHTPLIALQTVGLVAPLAGPKTKPSFIGGFLGLGLASGLFGSAVFSDVLTAQSGNELAQHRYPQALWCLEEAERLNAWDSRYAAAKADYLEKLFLATKDPAWSRKSDEATQRVLDLEKTDGQAWLEKAEKMTQRFEAGPTQDVFEKARQAWADAGVLLPFSGIEKFEEGLFYLHVGDKAQASKCFEAATQVEPNYAAAWVNAGLLLREKGEKAGALEHFQEALAVYDRWKDEQRIDPLEKQMVDLPAATLDFLRKETTR